MRKGVIKPMIGEIELIRKHCSRSNDLYRFLDKNNAKITNKLLGCGREMHQTRK